MFVTHLQVLVLYARIVHKRADEFLGAFFFMVGIARRCMV